MKYEDKAVDVDVRNISEGIYDLFRYWHEQGACMNDAWDMVGDCLEHLRLATMIQFVKSETRKEH